MAQWEALLLLVALYGCFWEGCFRVPRSRTHNLPLIVIFDVIIEGMILVPSTLS